MTSTAPATVTAPESVDRDRVLATLASAFVADPVMRWMYPDPARYFAHFSEVCTLMGGQAFDIGTVDCAADYAGAAIWLPPGMESDGEGLADLLQRSIDAERHEEAFAFLGQVSEYHPEEPCWYLPVIGVDPRCQGRGHGSQILARGLHRCDRDRLPAYLEASSPRNRALYERHGFAVIGEIRAGDSPPLWPMLRTAR